MFIVAQNNTSGIKSSYLIVQQPVYKMSVFHMWLSFNALTPIIQQKKNDTINQRSVPLTKV